MVVNKFVTILVLSSVFFSASALVFKDCGSLYGKVRAVTVAGCATTPQCILKAGTNISLSVTFTALEDTTKAKAVVHGIIAGVPVPFPFPQGDACQNSGLTCPLVNGQEYVYSTQIPISTSYPKIKVLVKWELQEDKGKDMFCIEIPAAIM